MGNPVPALVFGGTLIIAGVLMIAAQRRNARDLPSQAEDPLEYQFLNRRIRRRTQVAGLILLVGILILVGDALIPWNPRMLRTWGVYIIVLLALAGWIALLALGDMLATRTYMRNELNQLRRQHLELRNMAQRLKEQSRRSSEP